MSFWRHFKTLKSAEVRLAWLVALAADAAQIVAMPLFVEGGLSPADDLLDIAVAAILVRLLGWHWAFLPSLVAELLPGFDLFPTWTTAVWFVTRQLTAQAEEPRTEPALIGEPEILPPDAATRHRT
jgi:hypothetical protein